MLLYDTPNPVIREPMRLHRLRLIQVPPVEDNRFAQEAFHHLEVRTAEFLPLGDDGQAVGAFQGALGTVAIGQLVAVFLLHIGQRLRIVDTQVHAGLQHCIDQGQSRGFTDVVRAWLEGQAPDGQSQAL